MPRAVSVSRFVWSGVGEGRQDSSSWHGSWPPLKRKPGIGDFSFWRSCDVLVGSSLVGSSLVGSSRDAAFAKKWAADHQQPQRRPLTRAAFGMSLQKAAVTVAAAVICLQRRRRSTRKKRQCRSYRASGRCARLPTHSASPSIAPEQKRRLCKSTAFHSPQHEMSRVSPCATRAARSAIGSRRATRHAAPSAPAVVHRARRDDNQPTAPPPGSLSLTASLGC